MNQDWEWEDLLDDRPGKNRQGTRRTTGQGSVSRTRSASGGTGKTRTKSGSGTKKRTGKPGTSASPKKRKSGTTSPKEINTLTEGIRNIDGEAPALAGAPRNPHGSGKKRKRRRRRRSRAFLIFYLLFVLVLAVAGFIMVRRVYKTMEELRDNTPETYIRRSVSNLTDEEVAALFASNPLYETQQEAVSNIRAYLTDGNMTLKRLQHNEYEVYNGSRKLFTVRLNASRSVNKLGLLNYDIIESAGIVPVKDGELFHYEIKAPSTCVITVNGRPVGDPVKEEPVKGFADASDYVSIPSVNTYVLDHLTAEPDIRATDNGTELNVVLEEQTDLTRGNETTHTYATTEEAGIAFDAMEFARQWTMFNRNDLTGELHGYYRLEPLMIKGTQLQVLAYQYATSQDIGWTSNHTLLDPPFTDESVSNVVKYDENTASVEVSLKMHMMLDRGQERTDVIHTTLYLVRHEGEWKVVNTRDVEDEADSGSAKTEEEKPEETSGEDNGQTD